MSNAQVNAWLALKSLLDTWTGTAKTYPDEIYIPEADVEFIIAQDVSLDFENVTVSTNCGSEYRGTLNVSVMVPAKTWNYAEHKGLAARVCGHFAFGTKASYDGTTIQVFSPPRIIGNPRLDGAHNRLEVTIPYRYWG